MLVSLWSAASPAEPRAPRVPFLLLHPLKEQRLGPTPAESAREGGRHPSGLPGGAGPQTYPWQAGRPGSRAGTTELLAVLGSPFPWRLAILPN